ncbi:hypothetical protein CWT12_08650 [Actinomyces sp. 432]|nr:hypothetical protein CWT12_08650 [Actinomyces sp. 432]
MYCCGTSFSAPGSVPETTSSVPIGSGGGETAYSCGRWLRAPSYGGYPYIRCSPSCSLCSLRFTPGTASSWSGRRAAVLDPVIHPINRLRICATLKSVGAVNDGALVWTGTEMKFSALRDAVGLSDASLSKQLKALEDADYIRRHRDYGVIRAMDVVWVSLTPRGLKAFEDHVAALREIADD